MHYEKMLFLIAPGFIFVAMQGMDDWRQAIKQIDPLYSFSDEEYDLPDDKFLRYQDAEKMSELFFTQRLQCNTMHAIDRCLMLPKKNKKNSSERRLIKPCKRSCTECDKKFKLRATLYSHLRDLHKKDPFECECCKITFKHNNDLRSHICQYHISGSVACVHCGSFFSTVDKRDRHARYKHNKS